MLYINKNRSGSGRRYSIVSDWENISERKKQNYINMARLSIICVSSMIPINDSAALLHNNWVESNKNYATELQKKTYCLQTDYEKKRYEDIIKLVKEKLVEDISYIS